MFKDSFMVLFDELRTYIAKTTTGLSRPGPVKKHIAVYLYYLSEEGRMRKCANTFELGTNTVSKIVRRVTTSVSTHLSSKYIQLHSTK